ncbi:MAG: hypothetical protein ACXVPN_16730 [Bacteroidia bacterium]
MKINILVMGRYLKKRLPVNVFLVLFYFFSTTTVLSQGYLYDDFEGNRSLAYGERSGVLDTAAKNPSIDSVNSSKTCALYVRNGTKKFDNIKMPLPGLMSDVSNYATYLGIPPKLTMKIFTNAPPGTLVEILLGNHNGNNDYPAGTNSQYQAYTTTSNKWEQLEFKFSQIPQGSETATTQIDQITLLFNPNSANSDKYFFDELTGPPPAKSDGKSEIAKPAEENKKNKAVKKTESSKKTGTSKKITQK